jgi:hypothetical protein
VAPTDRQSFFIKFDKYEKYRYISEPHFSYSEYCTKSFATSGVQDAASSGTVAGVLLLRYKNMKT